MKKYTIEEIKNSEKPFAISLENIDKKDFTKLTTRLGYPDYETGLSGFLLVGKDCLYSTYHRTAGKLTITINDIDFLEDMEEEEIESIKIAKDVSEMEELEGREEVSWTTIDGKEYLVISGDKLRRYRIQKKLEDVFANDRDFWKIHSLQTVVERGFNDPDSANKRCIDLIGKEDLKFFFGIEETMTMKECIEKGLDFEFEGTIYYSINDELIRQDSDYNMGVVWCLKNQNEQVKIIKE